MTTKGSALVTGAARGIGAATALRLAADGFDVAIVDRDGDRLSTVAEQIRATGRQALPLVGDVTDADRVSEILAETRTRFGGLQVLVNNAGHGTAKPFLEITQAEWRSQIDLNLSAYFYFAQGAARLMRDQRYGRIIFIASVTGLAGPIDLAAYGAAKSGVYGLMRGMALELGEYGITVNSVAPGPINTELMREALSPEMQKIAGLRIPAGRVGEVDDVAGTVSFFASADAGFVNGATLTVDGGFTAAGGYMAELFRRRNG